MYPNINLHAQSSNSSHTAPLSNRFIKQLQVAGMKSLSPDRVVLVSVHPNIDDAFTDVKNRRDSVSHSPSTVSTSRSFDYHDIAVVSSFESDAALVPEKSKATPLVSFKIRSPERRKSRGRRATHSLSESLPPLIARTTSFDFLEESELKTSQDDTASIQMPDLHESKTAVAAAEQRPVFRAPLPRRKPRSSPVKNRFLSKSLTLIPSPLSLLSELESSLPENENKSFELDTSSPKKNTWFPLERSRELNKKSVRFSPDKDQVHLIQYDWSFVGNNDYFYSSAEIATMKSARYEDAAVFRDEDKRSSSTATDDLDVSRRQSVLCIDTLLNMALNHPDNDPVTSIRGIEHFVYPELQQEMIRKKKEVQAQVMNFVKSKKPDPQGWRLANHSRMYSQWARDVALEKGQAHAHQVTMDEELTKAEENDTARPTLRRKGSSRRCRRNSMCASLPTVGEGAAAAAMVQMQFFNALDEMKQSDALADDLQITKQDDEKDETDDLQRKKTDDVEGEQDELPLKKQDDEKAEHSQYSRDVVSEKSQEHQLTVDEEHTKGEDNSTPRSSLLRRAGTRRCRRNSMSSSLPKIGDGAAAAAMVQMQFFSVPDELKVSDDSQLQKQEDEKEEPEARFDESQDELEEA